MRGISIVIILIAALIAYAAYLRPTESQLLYVRTRLSIAQGELATVLGRTVIEPRLRREHEQIAKRLRSLSAESPSQAETRFVREAMQLARRTRTHITQIVSKGAALPLTLPTAAPAQPPAPSSATSPGTIGARPIAAQPPLATSLGDVRGMRLPRTLTVEGSFGNLLRFLDGLGDLRPVIRVNNAGLAQTDRLRATVELDIVVLEALQVREALQ